METCLLAAKQSMDHRDAVQLRLYRVLPSRLMLPPWVRREIQYLVLRPLFELVQLEKNYFSSFIHCI